MSYATVRRDTPHAWSYTQGSYHAGTATAALDVLLPAYDRACQQGEKSYGLVHISAYLLGECPLPPPLLLFAGTRWRPGRSATSGQAWCPIAYSAWKRCHGAGENATATVPKYQD